MARGVFVQGVSVQGNLCLGVSVQEGLCQGDPLERPPPYGNERVVRILLHSCSVGRGGGVRGMVQTSIINYENIVCFPVSSSKRMNIRIVGGCITSRNSTSWPCNLMAGKRIQTKDMIFSAS